MNLEFKDVSTIYYQNVGGMCSKSSLFSQFLLSSCFPVYVLCETWFHSGVLSSEFFTDNYVVHRCDRSTLTSAKSGGGGVLVAVHNSILNCEVPCPNYNIEFVALKLSWTVKSLYLYVAYIPPHSGTEIYSLHCENIHHFIADCNINDIICVLGDFNIPGIIWRTDDDDPSHVFPTNIFNGDDHIFIDSMSSLDLHQICKVTNLNGRVLDLVFMNDPNYCSITKSMTPFVPERLHHYGLEIDFDSKELFCRFNNHKQPMMNYNFKRADISGLNVFFENLDWDEIFNHKWSDIDALVDALYSVLFEAFDKYVPKSYNRMNNHPPWFDKNLINLRNRKNKAHRLAKLNGNNLLYFNSFRQLRRDFDNLHRLAYRSYISNLEDNLTLDPKLFWTFVDAKRKCSGYPQTMSLNDATANNVNDICELFADFFQAVYKKHHEDGVSSASTSQSGQYHHNVIGLPSISETSVMDAISKMKYGCGFDNIPTSILKDLSKSLSLPLSLVFNASLKSGTFPARWKKSIIIPIFKSGKRYDIKNYRGISILSSIPKLFELIVTDYLYFNVKSSLAIQQHGFIRQRSTTTNLLSLTSKVYDAFASRSQLDVIFTDFSKAFDTPQFDILLGKLDRFGVCKLFLDWIGSYLCERKQVVRINGITSKTIDVHSGVPQGSHLGPVLFIIFIDEIASLFKYCGCELYADDLKIFKIITTPQQCMELQSDLDLLYKWTISNKLYLNLEKCKVMSFFRRAKMISHPYHIDNHPLERVSTFKDLGVILDHQLNFRDHIDSIVAKSNRLLGFVRRATKDFRNPLSIKCLYCSLVRSNLEYASVIWDPMYKIDIDRIERVQKQLILHLLNKMNWQFDLKLPMWQNKRNLPPYTERCKIVNLESLSDRRKIAASMFIADVLMSAVDFTEFLANIDIHVPCKPVRVKHFIYLPTFKSNYAHNAPIPAMCRQFNINFNEFDFNLSKCLFKKQIKCKL